MSNGKIFQYSEFRVYLESLEKTEAEQLGLLKDILQKEDTIMPDWRKTWMRQEIFTLSVRVGLLGELLGYIPKEEG